MVEFEGKNFEAISSAEQQVLRSIKLLNSSGISVADRQKVIEELKKSLDHSRNVVVALQTKTANPYREQIIQQEQRIIELISQALESL